VVQATVSICIVKAHKNHQGTAEVLSRLHCGLQACPHRSDFGILVSKLASIIRTSVIRRFLQLSVKTLSVTHLAARAGANLLADRRGIKRTALDFAGEAGRQGGAGAHGARQVQQLLSSYRAESGEGTLWKRYHAGRQWSGVIPAWTRSGFASSPSSSSRDAWRSAPY